MPTRSRPEGDRTRERILEVALPLFAEHGYAGASVRTIASAAGVNVATLAYHFRDKDGLYECVVQRLHEDLLAAIPAVTPSGTTPEEVLAWLVRQGWEFVRAHRTHVRLLVRHLLDHGEQPAVVVENWSDRLLGRADLLLCAFRPDWPPHRRRLMILSMMHLTVRLVLEDPRQLSRVTGIAESDLEEEVVRWLSDLFARELGLLR